VFVIFVLSSEHTFNRKKSPRKTRKSGKMNQNKDEKINLEGKEEEESQKIKLLEPIIYEPDRNQRNIPLEVDDNNSFVLDQEQQISKDAKKITYYYLELYKNMINTYNSVYSQILQNNSDLSWDVFFTASGRFTNNYLFDIKKMYISLISNRDKSLKLIDSIITENLNAFMKSIELTQRFYKNIIESYLNCIKKVK
jgi:hypothetical protein